MSKRGENIYKRKDGRWEGRYIKAYEENGKIKYGYLYARSYSELKQKMIQVKASPMCPERTNKSVVLYCEVLSMWLRSTILKTKESTLSKYSHIINTHIRPALGNYPINMISTELIEDYIERKLQSGRIDNAGPLSSKTVIDILTIIKSTIEYAKECGFSVTCNLSRVSVRRKEKEMRVLSLSEQNALVCTLLRDTDRYKFGILLSLFTGIRIGELCALKWENFIRDSSILQIKTTLQRIQNLDPTSSNKTKIVITEPKSQCSIRDIPIPDCIIPLVNKFMGKKNEFVLTGECSTFVEPRTMQNKFKKYLIESGVCDANYHSLRHTFATRCVEMGFEIKSLSEILGHSSVNITLSRYVHSSFELKTNNMNKLNSLL